MSDDGGAEPSNDQAPVRQRRSWESVIFIPMTATVQALLIVLFFVFTDVQESLDATQQIGPDVTIQYKMYSDIAGMVFIGFGMLVMFLRRYGNSALALTFFIACICIQWAILCVGFFRAIQTGFTAPIHLNVRSLTEGLMGAATVLISFGSVIGKISPTGLIIMGLLEIIFYSVNKYTIVMVMSALDIGGTMAVHVFGAYFGLSVTWITSPASSLKNPEATSGHRSDMLSIIGTLFLWIYWPSFNAAFGVQGTQQRAIVNTVMAQLGSCVAAFACSRLVRHTGKFEMRDLQNATIAGGVAIGSAADIVLHPGGALVSGVVAGIICTIGFCFVTPLLLKYLKIHDTRGIHNLHGMPGILGGLVSVIAAGVAVPLKHKLGANYDGLFLWRNAQAGAQAIALGISVLLAVIGGIFTGATLLVFRLVISRLDSNQVYFQDAFIIQENKTHEQVAIQKRDEELVEF